MDIIYESASNFTELENTKYHFVFVQNRKSHDIVLDFLPSDFRHATGLHYVTDIVIENNPVKLIDAILHESPPTVTDTKLNESKKYKEITPTMGSVKERVSDIRFLEKCLDTSDFMRIYQIQSFGSQICADYFIESYCKDIKTNIYIFIRKRKESDNYVVVSYFRKKVTFNGTSTHWLLKEKITNSFVNELYRRSTYNGNTKQKKTLWKNLESYEDVFTGTINVLIFNGEQRVAQESRLEDKCPEGEIITRLQKRFQLTEEKAKYYFEKYSTVFA